MIDRSQAVALINNQLKCDRTTLKKDRFHYGVLELRELLDLIYDETPKNEKENIYAYNIWTSSKKLKHDRQ